MALNRPIIKLDVFDGDWGLPSIDIESLRFLGCTRFSGTEFEVRKVKNPFWCSKALPVAHYGRNKIIDFDELQALLKSKNVSPDEALTRKQLAETQAYTVLLKEKLYPAVLYTWWLDEKNYTSVTKPWYAKKIPFPFNFYYIRKYWNHANSVMEVLSETPGTQSSFETKVFSDAEKCLTSISLRLGDSEFMYGSHPTSLDATLFAYLAPLLKVPFKNSKLQNYIKGCNNLQKFVTRISQRYYPNDSQDYETKKKKETSTTNVNSGDPEFPNKRRNQFFASLFALIAMLGYAISTGIVQIPDVWPRSSKLQTEPMKIRLSLL